MPIDFCTGARPAHARECVIEADETLHIGVSMSAASLPEENLGNAFKRMLLNEKKSSICHGRHSCR